jgi:hypothetical protein
MDATTAEDTQKKLQDLLARVAAGHPLSYAESEFLKGRTIQPKYQTLGDVAAYFSISTPGVRRWEAKYPEAFSVDEVLAQVRAVMYAIKEKIKRIPPEMAYEVSGVSPAEAEERLFTCIDKILREMEHEDYVKIEEQLKAKKVDVEMMEVEIAPAEPVKRGRPRKS